jgi:general stress protein 26
MEIITKASALIENCEEVILASVSEDGHPRPCVMSKIKTDGIRKIWVTTGLSGAKTQHFLKNPKAGLCCYKNGNSITLVGKVLVRTDAEIKAEMWLDWFIDYFPGGVDDPNYCVLEFETEEATFWIDREFVTVNSEQLNR